MALENRAARMPGPQKDLECVNLPLNRPGAGEVLVRNYAIAIQPLDAKMLLSGYSGAVNLHNYPALLGTSGAGIIEELGEGVDGFAIGDRVVFDTKAYT